MTATADRSRVPWTRWEFPHRAPVVAPGQLHPAYDRARAGACQVVRAGDRLRMLYWGSDASEHYSILQAQAPLHAPNDWSPVGSPLLGRRTDAGDYNTQGPSFPFVVTLDERRWLMYFVAWGAARADGKLPNCTGCAVSDDAGLTWRDHGPVLKSDRPYDRECTGSVCVLREGATLRMYYTAIGAYHPRPAGVAPSHHGALLPRIGIAYAESSDGLTWSKPVDGLLVAPRGFGVEPYEYICSKPWVIKTEDGYIMWVNTYGTAYRVHRLSSRDGIAWAWDERRGPDGELGVGEPGAFDDFQRSYPCMVQEGDTLHCWFTGNRFGTTGMGYARSQRAGVATG